ncbi:MAG: M14 family zinc carboxypeptidase [Melioribacteraceae bacterium]|nr:M14 family zinc carboxypeptidase [Melioribacteraceae bacterium]
MKKIILVLMFISTLMFAENYKKVKVYISNKAEIVELLRIGIPLDDAYQNRDGSLDIFLNEAEFKSLNNTSINYNVIIDNWDKHYTELQEKSSNNFSLSKNISQFKVNGFTKGSMGGFYTLDEVWQKIDEMISLYPNLISIKDSIGASDEGRPIYAVRISDNPNINEDEPEVLYTALIHAKEPESMMQMIYYMFYLLENYGTDAEATYLIDNREMYFIPVINPDGYVYNESTNPNGGGMWRKNRQYNIDGSYGVDLNRNFGYKWGYADDLWTSSNPSSNVYRGTAGFSEPETETVRQYCIENNFRLALNYHTYSNLLITPWGYIPEETPDSIFYRKIATDMTQYNNYTWGYSAEIIYAVNGDSDDWFYGEQTEKNKIYAMTPEVGNGSDGFWPAEDRIIPLAEENVYPNLYLAWVGGGFVNTLNFGFDKESYSAGDTGSISIELKNKGLEDITNVKTIVNISDNALLLSGNNFNIGSISSRTSVSIEDDISFMVNDTTQASDSVFIELNYYSGELLLSTDNYSFVVGAPKTYYIDSLNTLENWSYKSNVSKNWEVTTNTFYTTPSSVTDSRIGDYLSNTESVLTSSAIDLTSISSPYLKFKTKYNIESGWDYGQVSISTDSITWQPIGGGSSKIGSGNFQPSNEYIYDGNQSEWITEIVNLNEYSGNQIYLKFEFNSDEYIEEDGWYIDDVEIFQYSNNIVSVNDELEFPTAYSLLQNYPNPFNPTTKIKYSIPVETRHGVSPQNISLKIYDILGREVATLVNKKQSAGNYEIIFNATNLTSGIYFYRLISGDFLESRKMLLLK